MIFARLSSRRGTRYLPRILSHTIAFGAMLKQIMRKDNPRKTGQIVPSRTQRELKAEAFAEICTKKCPKPCAATLRDGENDGVTA